MTGEFVAVRSVLRLFGPSLLLPEGGCEAPPGKALKPLAEVREQAFTSWVEALECRRHLCNSWLAMPCGCLPPGPRLRGHGSGATAPQTLSHRMAGAHLRWSVPWRGTAAGDRSPRPLQGSGRVRSA